MIEPLSSAFRQGAENPHLTLNAYSEETSQTGDIVAIGLRQTESANDMTINPSLLNLSSQSQSFPATPAPFPVA